MVDKYETNAPRSVEDGDLLNLLRFLGPLFLFLWGVGPCLRGGALRLGIGLDLLLRGSGRGGPLGIGRLLYRWRDRAWDHALQLATAPDQAGWDAMVGEVERDGGAKAIDEAVGDLGRDYFIARTVDERWLWIYRDGRVPGGWLLHGYFS